MPWVPQLWMSYPEACARYGRERVLPALIDGRLVARDRIELSLIPSYQWRPYAFRNRILPADPVAGWIRDHVEYGDYPFDPAVDEGDPRWPDGIADKYGTAELNQTELDALFAPPPPPSAAEVRVAQGDDLEEACGAWAETLDPDDARNRDQFREEAKRRLPGLSNNAFARAFRRAPAKLRAPGRRPGSRNKPKTVAR